MENKPDYLSGFLQRQNMFRIWVRRYAVIKGSCLIFYKDDSRQKVDYSFDITPDVIINIADSKDAHRFSVVARGLTLNCCAESTDHLMRWVLAIRGCTFNSKKVTMDDFNIVSVIGRGFYGKVMLCEKKVDGEVLAIKSVQKWKLVQSKKVQTVLIERSILEQVNFPFIVSMKFAFQTDRKFYLGIEYVPGGELFHHLQEMKSLPLSEVKLYIAEIALALNYLHSHGIIYRDLKPENVLIAADGHVKLTDFGLSKICDVTSTFCGTSEYLAPETVLHMAYGKQVDWWALGILTYELLFGSTPFYSHNRVKLFNLIVHSEPQFPEGADPSVVSFIKFVLNKDPRKRPGFHEIRRTDFFKDLDFEKVLKKEVPTIFVPKIQNKFNLSNFDEEFTKEMPADSITGLDVDKEDQYFAGFSYNDQPAMFDSDSERSFHSDDDNKDDLLFKLMYSDSCSSPKDVAQPGNVLAAAQAEGLEIFTTDLI